MPRLPRFQSRPDAMMEIVNRTFQGHHLCKPSPRFNAIFIGALAKAQQRYPTPIHFAACMGNHWHLLISPPNLKAQARFLRFFTQKLSREISRLHGWEGSVFPNRYKAIEVADEAEAQRRRLKYLLSQGSKEGLVASPLDWPGPQFTKALVDRSELRGIWIDRQRMGSARRRGAKVRETDFTEELVLKLAPLPYLAHLSLAEQKQEVVSLIRQIEDETSAQHRVAATAPMGPRRILAGNPWARSPKPDGASPRFHVTCRRLKRSLSDSLSAFLHAYRDAANRLRRGSRGALFPENCFPPSLPFHGPSHRVSR